MSELEIVATSFSIICVILTIRRSIWNWATGIVGILAYMVLFYQYKLYADMGLQVVYLGQSIYGWYYWHQQKLESKVKTPVFTLSGGQWAAAIFSVVMLWGAVWALLFYCTDGDIPHWDALATAICLTAQALVAWKFLENWFFWIVGDLLLVFIFMYKELYLSAGTYTLFLALAVVGWWQWRKRMKNEE